MRRGDWMQTYTGRQFWPLDPRAEEVVIGDIAHSLSLQCRFAGHTREPYSVAEHCVRVSLLLEAQYGNDRELHLMGLLHDSSEAYLVDLPRPVKRHLKGYAIAEDTLMEIICERFGLRWVNDPRWLDVMDADNVLLATEARDLMCDPPAQWERLPDPLPKQIAPWSWQEAEHAFLQRFDALGGRHHG